MYSAVPARKEGCCSLLGTTVLATGWGRQTGVSGGSVLDAFSRGSEPGWGGPWDSSDPHQGCTARVGAALGERQLQPASSSCLGKPNTGRYKMGAVAEGWMPPGLVWATDQTCVSHVLRLLPWNGIPSVGFTDGLREAVKWGRYQLRGRSVLCLSSPSAPA